VCVCDANYKLLQYFTFVDFGAYSKNYDSRIFQNSVLRNKISVNDFNIPDLRYQTGDSRNNLLHVFVGDESVGLSTHIMKPYSGKILSVEKKSIKLRTLYSKEIY
jgi:hypothetical protein